MSKQNSPYSASFTGATMMYSEMNIVVSMLLEDNSPETVKKMKSDAQYLQLNSMTGRERVVIELVKRFNAVPRDFWERYITLGEPQQRLALFYVLLKTYRLLFEFQVDFALAKFNSIDRTVSLNDVLAMLSGIAANDEFVDSWAESTRHKICSSYLTILKQSNLLNSETGELTISPLDDIDFVYYIQTGDLWFLQACFLPGYRIEQIKQLAI